MTTSTTENDTTLQLTAEIVAAHTSRNPVAPDQLPGLIKQVYETLKGLGKETVSVNKAEPAVNPKRSVFADYIICLEDGMKLKMLKRHLASAYGMTPEQYRTKWGLSRDYPMTAPAYTKVRSGLAKRIGLGTKPQAQSEPAAASADPEPEPEPAPAAPLAAPKKAGAKKAAKKAAPKKKAAAKKQAKKQASAKAPAATEAPAMAAD